MREMKRLWLIGCLRVLGLASSVIALAVTAIEAQAE